LAEHFLRLFAREMNLPHPALGGAALSLLAAYDFPGNVHELKNIIERALIESGGEEIREEHLHFVCRGPAVPGAGPPASEGRSDDCREDPHRPTAVGSTIPSEETAILDHVRRMGNINNTECRRLLGADMHRAWYLLHKLHQAGQLKQENDRRWARYRLP
jgi:DNA-binding NtrC family response regulator